MTPTFAFCSDFDLCCVISVPGGQGGEQAGEWVDGAVEGLLGFYLHEHTSLAFKRL